MNIYNKLNGDLSNWQLLRILALDQSCGLLDGQIDQPMGLTDIAFLLLVELVDCQSRTRFFYVRLHTGTFEASGTIHKGNNYSN